MFTKHRCLSPVLPISDFHPELLRCMETAASFYKKGQALKRPGRFFGYMNVIADILAETLSLGLRKEGEEEILSQVLRWILEHYREKITQEQVAGLWESAVLHCPGCLQKRWSVLFWIILTVSG